VCAFVKNVTPEELNQKDPACPDKTQSTPFSAHALQQFDCPGFRTLFMTCSKLQTEAREFQPKRLLKKTDLGSKRNDSETC